MKSNFKTFIFSAVFVCSLIGCTVGPDFERPMLYENTQIEKALDLKPNTKNIQSSYSIFNDEILNRLISMAVANSPTVRQAISAVKQARLLVEISSVKGLPTLDVAAQYEYVKESRNIGYVFNQTV